MYSLAYVKDPYGPNRSGIVGEGGGSRGQVGPRSGWVRSKFDRAGPGDRCKNIAKAILL
jgi:hypothetical protein